MAGKSGRSGGRRPGAGRPVTKRTLRTGQRLLLYERASYGACSSLELVEVEVSRTNIILHNRATGWQYVLDLVNTEENMRTIYNPETEEYETTGPDTDLIGFGNTPGQSATNYLEQLSIAARHRAKNGGFPADDPRSDEERARDDDLQDLRRTQADLRASLRGF